MKKISHSGYLFPPEIIQQAIWLYLRFTLSFRDVEDLLAERGIVVSYKTIRRWVNHFGPLIAAGPSVYGASRVVETGSAYGVNCRIDVDTSTRISAPRRASPTNSRASPDQNLPGS